VFRLPGYGLKLLSPFFTHLQSRLDMLLVDESPPGIPGEEEKKKLPVWAIILIIVAVLVCCAPIAVIAILNILGPTIGNVFSNVIMNL
jgi:hypothetical protein